MISQSSITVGKIHYGEKQFKSYELTKTIDRALQRLGHGPDDPKRLVLNVPPQTGKTSSLTNFIAEYKAEHPHNAVMYITYGDIRAGKIGMQAKDTFSSIAPFYDLTIDPQSRSKKEWEIVDSSGRKCRGSVIARGTSEAITGYEADLVIIDDPYKGPEDSGSMSYRQKIKDLWDSTISTRLAEDAIIIMTMTRWHVDDICGHLLRQEEMGHGDKWDKLIIPAIADEDVYSSWGEFVLRKGESPHCRFSQAHFEKRKASVDRWVWHALYMQKPMTAFGSMWPHFEPVIVSELPRRPEYLALGIDNATGTEMKQGSDSAIVSVATCADGFVYVDADLSRSGPSQMIERLIRFIKNGPRIPDIVGIENFQFQDFIREIGAAKLYEAGIDCLVEGLGIEMKHPITGKIIVNPQKEDRIASSLDPLITRNIFRFFRTQGCAKLITQLVNFPTGDVGLDGPDGLDIALRALERFVQMQRVA